MCSDAKHQDLLKALRKNVRCKRTLVGHIQLGFKDL